jgi:tripartite-type tricarboxylate transporter receptor subunit TctC
VLERSDHVPAVRPSKPASRTVGLIPQMMARPSCPASSGSVVGANSRLDGGLLRIEAGIDIAPVRQRGTFPSVQDVVAGRVPMTIGSLVVLIPLVRCGTRNAPDATHGQRIAKSPEMPAAPETLPDFQATVINDLAARGGTPTPTRERLNQTLGWAVASAAAERRHAGTASLQDGSTQRAPGRPLAEEHEEWRAPGAHAGIKAEQEGNSP